MLQNGIQGEANYLKIGILWSSYEKKLNKFKYMIVIIQQNAFVNAVCTFFTFYT